MRIGDGMRLHGVRASLLLTAAFVADPAGAQTVAQSSPNSITYEPGTVTDNPAAISLRSTRGGSVAATVGGATSTSTTTDVVTVIDLGAVTNGAAIGGINAAPGTLTTTAPVAGSACHGLNAATQSGSITIAVNAIDEAGAFTCGVFAQSTGASRPPPAPPPRW